MKHVPWVAELPSRTARRPHRHKVHKSALDKDYHAMVEAIVREVIDIEQWYCAELWAQERDALIERMLRQRVRRT